MAQHTGFEGEVVLITGGGGGIGRATALAFAAQGAKVVVADRHDIDAGQTVELIRAAGGDALFVACDVTRNDDVQAMVAQALQHYGALHHAVNNAGIEGDAGVAVTDYAEATWDAVIGVNLKGVFLCLKHELPAIVQSQGTIVNMASVAGLSGSRIGAAYHASKHGVIGLTKACAMEVANQGVRVNAVAPGVIHTAMAERLGFVDDKVAARLVGLHPLGRVGTPQEVANAVLWLCSKQSSFVTGHTLAVDGGFLIP